MPTKNWDEKVPPSHQAAGYCCVLLAACYVTAIIVLVAYLIATKLW